MKLFYIILALLLCSASSSAQVDSYADDDASSISTEPVTIKLNDDYLVTVRQIPHNEYVMKMEASQLLREKPHRIITDPVEAQRMLRKSVKVIEVNSEAFGEVCPMIEITYKDGKKKRFDYIQRLTDGSFVAYYPKLGILILEGEAGGNESIDLNDSTNEHVGNPEYYATSPDHHLRTNGYYPGGAYDTNLFWLEKWNRSKRKYEFVCDFEVGNDQFYGIEHWNWIDNNKVLFKKYNGYFEMEIKDLDLQQSATK